MATPEPSQLDDSSFSAGSLRATSHARPGKLFTAGQTLIVAQVGRLKPEPLQQIVDSVVNLLRAGASSARKCHEKPPFCTLKTPSCTPFAGEKTPNVAPSRPPIQANPPPEISIDP